MTSKVEDFNRIHLYTENPASEVLEENLSQSLRFRRIAKPLDHHTGHRQDGLPGSQVEKQSFKWLI